MPTAREDGPSGQSSVHETLNVGVGERWRFKPNRGVGVFTVIAVYRAGGQVVLKGPRTKTIKFETLRSDYERCTYEPA